MRSKDEKKNIAFNLKKEVDFFEASFSFFRKSVNLMEKCFLSFYFLTKQKRRSRKKKLKTIYFPPHSILRNIHLVGERGCEIEKFSLKTSTRV